MLESDFEYDRTNTDEGARRFPAHRQTVPTAQPQTDVSYLRRAVEFVRHAWDEGGH